MTARVLSVLLLACAQLARASSTFPMCNGTVNEIPAHTDAPIFVRAVPNGRLYNGGGANDTFFVMHVYGTPYQMGYAHGQLFQKEIPLGLKQFYAWIADSIQQILPWLPPEIADLVVKYGAPIALEWSYNMTHPFTPSKYDEEMQGVADGAGVSVWDIRNINMIAELIRAQCSVIGANGPATRNTLDGTLLHLRTLDGMGGATAPMKDYALVTVYHPTSGPAVANFGWVSFIGTVTGFSQTVGVGEKFWNNPPAHSMSAHGEAWTFITRDLLSAPSLDDALATLHSANRTCAVMLGLGDHATNRFVGAQVAAHQYNLFNDTSINYPEHPIYPGIVYWDKYDQPSNNFCFMQLFAHYSGNLTAPLLATTVAPLAQTGDLHAAIFDYHNQIAYFANARKSSVTSGGLNSYDRQFTRLDMAALFAEPQHGAGSG
eukprot:m.265448 g.265448  ORF g.265448 m.265448 type:complete len:431 (-) comp29675_c0_seq1:85-1377(-)